MCRLGDLGCWALGQGPRMRMSHRQLRAHEGLGFRV